MATPLSASKIISQLKKFNVPYKEYPGWKSRARPGTFSPNGFMVHHTGGGSGSASYLKFLFETGRPAEGIPGPLCQFAIDANGLVHVGAIGRANHAGRGSSTVLNKVMAESYSGYSSELKPGPDNIDGNARYYGVEVIYTGSSPMTTKQYNSTVRLAAAIVDAYGWSALSVIAHREHSSRKWDPGQTPMAKFRRDVRDVLNGTSTPTPQPKEWWEMPIPQADLEKIAEFVWKRVNPTEGRQYGTIVRNTEGAVAKPIRLDDGRDQSPRWIWKWSYQHHGTVRKVVESLIPLIEASGKGEPLTAGQVKEIADACAVAVADALPADIAKQFVAALKEAL